MKKLVALMAIVFAGAIFSACSEDVLGSSEPIVNKDKQSYVDPTDGYVQVIVDNPNFYDQQVYDDATKDIGITVYQMERSKKAVIYQVPLEKKDELIKILTGEDLYAPQLIDHTHEYVY